MKKKKLLPAEFCDWFESLNMLKLLLDPGLGSINTIKHFGAVIALYTQKTKANPMMTSRESKIQEFLSFFSRWLNLESMMMRVGRLLLGTD